MYGLLIAVASLVERGLEGVQASVTAEHRLTSCGSQALEHRLSCSEAPGIFPDQGLNPCLLHWQAGSLPLSHQGRPACLFTRVTAALRMGVGDADGMGGESGRKEMSKDITASTQVRGDDGFDQGCIVGFWL